MRTEYIDFDGLTGISRVVPSRHQANVLRVYRNSDEEPTIDIELQGSTDLLIADILTVVERHEATDPLLEMKQPTPPTTSAQVLEVWKPDWALGRAGGMYLIGAQLPTRDGRRTGNAHIIDIKYPNVTDTPENLYLVLTDAGTEMKLMAREVDELFYPPEWVSDVKQVLAKFSREPWLFTSQE